MYKKSKVEMLVVFVVFTGISYILEINYTAIASEAINILAIASAIYLAAYAGVQSNPELSEKLKIADKYMRSKSELYIFNTYIKTALIFGFVTIAISVYILLLSNKLGIDKLQYSSPIPLLFRISSSIAIGVFAINFVSMWKIGELIVKRIAYGK